MPGPPRIEGRVQPILNCLRLELVETQFAPSRDDVLMKVEDLLLPCWPGDLVGSPKVARLIHLGHFTEERDAGGGDLLDSGFHGGWVQLCQEFVALDFGLFFGDGVFGLAGADRLVLPERLERGLRLHLVVPIPEHPGPTLTIFPGLYLRMLNSHLDTQASSQHVEVTFTGEHHSSPIE